jgi:hypothetical protein
VGLLGGFAQQVQLSNIERLDLASAGASGLRLRFEATDVAAITAGSDFQRSTLGFGLSGAGGVLFVDAGANQLDLGGWSALGWAVVNGANYQLHQSGTSILGLLGGDPTPSGSSGGDIAGDDLVRRLRRLTGSDPTTGRMASNLRDVLRAPPLGGGGSLMVPWQAKIAAKVILARCLCPGLFPTPWASSGMAVTSTLPIPSASFASTLTYASRVRASPAWRWDRATPSRQRC